jgi:hypothetical protein
MSDNILLQKAQSVNSLLITYIHIFRPPTGAVSTTLKHYVWDYNHIWVITAEYPIDFLMK